MKMRVAQVFRAGGPLERVERPIPTPGPRHVRTLERAAEAYDRMMSGNARFRVVITTGT